VTRFDLFNLLKLRSAVLRVKQWSANFRYDDRKLPFHERPQIFFQGETTSTSCIFFLGCWQMTMQCKWTFTKRFALSTPKRKWSILRQSSQKCTFLDVLWRRFTIWITLSEFVKLLFLNVMQLCKPIRAAQSLRCCFERYELVPNTAKFLWHEDIAFDEWSVT